MSKTSRAFKETNTQIVTLTQAGMHKTSQNIATSKLEQLTKRPRITEVCHIGHFWLSYGRSAMSGSPMGWSEGSR